MFVWVNLEPYVKADISMSEKCVDMLRFLGEFNIKFPVNTDKISITINKEIVLLFIKNVML